MIYTEQGRVFAVKDATVHIKSGRKKITKDSSDLKNNRSKGKSIHYYVPHIYTCQNGRGLHRLTACAVENKGAYKSTVHIAKVTCKRCLDAIPKILGHIT